MLLKVLFLYGYLVKRCVYVLLQVMHVSVYVFIRFGDAFLYMYMRILFWRCDMHMCVLNVKATHLYLI